MSALPIGQLQAKSMGRGAASGFAAPVRARETKFAGAPLSGITSNGLFEGYASLFGIADLGGDLVMPGAFRESLLRRGASGVKMLWQHNPAEPIGTWQDLGEDRRGLIVRGRLDLAVSRAREVHALMKSGAVDGLSIGFKTQRSRRDEKSGLRRLEKLDLWEVSVVTFPMLPEARISAVKQRFPLERAEGRDEPRVLIDAIRRASAVFLQPRP
jgi:HK97 family phage prohead protease